MRSVLVKLPFPDVDARNTMDAISDTESSDDSARPIQCTVDYTGAADTASSLYADVCRENRPVQRSLTKQHFTCSLTPHDQAARPSTQGGK